MGGACLAETLLVVAMLAQVWLPDESGRGRVDREQTVSQVAKVSHFMGCLLLCENRRPICRAGSA